MNLKILNVFAELVHLHVNLGLLLNGEII